MDRNSQNSQGYKLESQIREAYGRVVYTQTCHDKIIHRLLNINERMKMYQIILSAVTTTGFVATIFVDEKVVNAIGALVSLLLLIINTYAKNFNLVETAQKHKEASDLLWKIREEYVSLLTDFELLEVQEILSKRDQLQERTSEVYSNSPRTDSKSYREAQKALKIEEEQTFSEWEIDVMLPDSIKRSKRKVFEE